MEKMKKELEEYKTFNSLTDSHSRSFEELAEVLDIDFQFPNGFSHFCLQYIIYYPLCFQFPNGFSRN